MPYVAAHFEQQLELYKTLVGLLYQILRSQFLRRVVLSRDNL